MSILYFLTLVFYKDSSLLIPVGVDTWCPDAGPASVTPGVPERFIFSFQSLNKKTSLGDFYVGLLFILFMRLMRISFFVLR